jgi:Holliday junction resolvase RusA-like endonuclease
MLETQASLKCVIPFQPVSWKRPAQTKTGIRYDSQVAIKQGIAFLVKKAMAGNPPLDGPLFLQADFYFKTPKKNHDKLIDTPYCRTPDIDNCLKLLLDSCNNIAFLDDSQICYLQSSKRFSDNPRTELKLHKV